MIGQPLPQVGEVFTVRYPFVRATFEGIDDSAEGVQFVNMPTWKPGVRHEQSAENIDVVADAMGSMELTVISVHKPGRYPTRVFFTRQFVNPDGKRFGKNGLKVVALEKFRRLSTAFQIDFDLTDARAL